ncbi:MAG: division/cell wall cluster transcriptional repressor MraZ, partial [Gammaproteobacteria bacterium]
DEWQKVEAKLVRLPTLNPKTRRFQRLFLGHASECDMDGQGRLLIPGLLRDYACLNKKLVLVGQVNKFELWSESVWDQKRKELLAQNQDMESLPEELENLIL